MTNDDKMTLVSLIGIIEKLDDGSKKYIMGVADGMSFCNMQKERKENLRAHCEGFINEGSAWSDDVEALNIAINALKRESSIE